MSYLGKAQGGARLMMARMVWAAAIILGLFAHGPAQAQGSSVQAVGDVLRMDDTLAIMQREAEQTAQEVAPDLFGGTVPEEWVAAVSALYDPLAARAQFDAALGTALAGVDPAQLAEVQSYFNGALGAQILGLELSAREAMLADDVEAAAQATWAGMQADPLPATTLRVDLIRQIVAANELVETNVTAALNGNLAFYQGLADAGLGAELTSEQMLAEVWASEGEVRADIEEWLFPYLALAYAPLTEDELRDYIDFSTSPAGQMVNSVLFRAFDALGAVQSRGMGLAAGRLMTGQDI